MVRSARRTAPNISELRGIVQSYTIGPRSNYRGGNNGKSNQRASAASCGAARSAVARGEVGSSDFRDRVFEQYRSIPQINPTDPNYLGGFAPENGAGTKGEMGEGSEWIAASEGSDGLGSCQTHHVSVSPQEDRGGTKGTLGTGEGASKEGGLEPAEPITHIVLHSYSSEEYRQLCCL